MLLIVIIFPINLHINALTSKKYFQDKRLGIYVLIYKLLHLFSTISCTRFIYKLVELGFSVNFLQVVSI